MVVEINRFKYFSVTEKLLILISLQSERKRNVMVNEKYNKDLDKLIKEFEEDFID